MNQRDIVNRLLSQITKARSLRGTSLVITVFGDSISPHGGSIWLGSLIRAMEPLGINERLVRTSVYRLVKEGWLDVTRIGRRSYYTLTESGKNQFEKADRRIYSAERPDWDGEWTLVYCSTVPAGKKEELRKNLHWQGFGQLAPDLFAHPKSNEQSLDETLTEMGLFDHVIVLNAAPRHVASTKALKLLARTRWGLDKLGREYQHFLSVFRPVMQTVNKLEEIEPEVCFQLRTLLIHEYRRLLLRDTDLPVELLPSGWPGLSAQHLTANLYALLGPGAEHYLQSTMENADGYLPKARPAYYRRFRQPAE
jgi:phenylacetic acid degradation operon negative regulatory protein